MKQLVFPRSTGDLRADLDRIVRVCAEAGYEIDRETAAWAWMDAAATEGCDGWMLASNFRRDARIVRHIVDSCEVVDQPPTTTVDGDATGAEPSAQENHP